MSRNDRQFSKRLRHKAKNALKVWTGSGSARHRYAHQLLPCIEGLCGSQAVKWCRMKSCQVSNGKRSQTQLTSCCKFQLHGRLISLRQKKSRPVETCTKTFTNAQAGTMLQNLKRRFCFQPCQNKGPAILLWKGFLLCPRYNPTPPKNHCLTVPTLWLKQRKSFYSRNHAKLFFSVRNVQRNGSEITLCKYCLCQASVAWALCNCSKR